jgi:predicted dehydrogenase
MDSPIEPPIRLGVIGCGQVVEQSHVPALLESPGIVTVAVADVSRHRGQTVAEALSARSRPSIYSDHRAMLEYEDMTLVLLATPPGVRREQALDVASSHRHILCEKPIATTLAAADSIVTACERFGVRCLMVHNYASFYEHLRACELIHQGAVGRPQTVILQGLGSSPWDGVPDFQPGWRQNPLMAGGGRLMDTGVHGLYLAEMFFGERPQSASADICFGPTGPPTDVRCFARYRFRDGLALLHVGEGHGSCSIEILGDGGRIEMSYPADTSSFDASPTAVSVYRDGTRVLCDVLGRSRAHNLTPAFYTHVLARLRQAPAYLHSGHHGRDLLATMMATYLSARERRQIDLAMELSPSLRQRGALELWA